MSDLHDTGLTCFRCGSSSVIPDAYLVDTTYGATVAVEAMRAPRAIVMKGKERTPARAQVCGVCGYVELFAEDPEAIWAAYLEREAGRS